MTPALSRKAPRRSRLRAILTLMAVGAVAAALAQTPPAESTNGMAAFGKMMPEGFVNRGVKVPSFDKGNPSSLLTAETVTRLDDRRLSAEQVVVEIYGKTPAENLRVDLKTAIYDMEDQILRSGDRSRVSRTDFEMEGDSLVFDAVKSIGSMKGRVRTLIFDTEAVSGKSEETQPTSKP